MSDLVEVLKSNDIHVSSKGNICLNDFVEKIIGSKNPNGYMKTIKDKFEYKNKFYVTQETCMEIIEKGKSKKCKKILKEIKKNDSSEEETSVDDSSIISVDDNIFQYTGKRFTSVFVIKDDGDWDVWVKAVEIADYLEYENTTRAIRKFVDKENKLSYEKFLEIWGQTDSVLPKNLDKKTIFINLSGFFNLIHGSKQKLAKEIKKWLDNEVLPSLIKYGSYSMQPKTLDIKLFYDSVAISKFYMKAALYIGFIGKIGKEFIFKYGLSRKMFERDHQQHSKNFDKFQVVFIGECDNCEQVESLFENDMKAYGLHRQLSIKDKKYTELFTISIKRTYSDIIKHMQDLINTHKLPAIKEATDQIARLENVVDTFNRSEEIKKLELQFKMSDNYKLEMEKDIKMKEIEIRRIEAETKLLNVQLKIERIRNKQTNDVGQDETDTECFNILDKDNMILCNKKRRKGDNVTKL